MLKVTQQLYQLTQQFQPPVQLEHRILEVILIVTQEMIQEVIQIVMTILQKIRLLKKFKWSSTNVTQIKMDRSLILSLKLA